MHPGLSGAVVTLASLAVPARPILQRDTHSAARLIASKCMACKQPAYLQLPDSKSGGLWRPSATIRT